MYIFLTYIVLSYVIGWMVVGSHMIITPPKQEYNSEGNCTTCGYTRCWAYCDSQKDVRPSEMGFVILIFAPLALPPIAFMALGKHYGQTLIDKVKSKL